MLPRSGWSHQSFDPDVGAERWAKARAAHCQAFFGSINTVWHASTNRQPRVDVYEFAPSEARPFWTYVTAGMSDCEQCVPASAPEWVVPRTELVLYTPERAPWAASLLHGFARYPFDFGTHFFWWHTVPVGGPIDGKDAHLSSLVLLPPYFEEEGFDELQVDGVPARFLWVVPITEAEREYAMVYGTQKLEKLFEQAELDPVTDPDRRSVI